MLLCVIEAEGWLVRDNGFFSEIVMLRRKRLSRALRRAKEISYLLVRWLMSSQSVEGRHTTVRQYQPLRLVDVFTGSSVRCNVYLEGVPWEAVRRLTGLIEHVDHVLIVYLLICSLYRSLNVPVAVCSCEGSQW